MRAGTSPLDATAPDADTPTSYIVRWSADTVPEAFRQESVIDAHYSESRTVVARPKVAGAIADWRARWSQDDRVVSLEPNQRVRAAKLSNDPLLDNERYLDQIHAQEAWDVTTGTDGMIIAVVDTGVDRSHPDLEGRLLPGINLVKPNSPPDDDNGHGTNVAGVIAAAADNDKGTAGLLWNARVLPIKALEADGNGDEDKLGEGIRYAINHNAKIVVLSLGLNKYSSYMQEIVNEAEARGVLLVAASGNEGNAVKYPAAYDTVLAVGGVGPDNVPESKSNHGPELDLMAPWIVFTTMRGGGYGYQEGTSMAAPQVAGAAALAWSMYPELRPAELRSLLRQTAEDLDTQGWDAETGYGLVRLDRAVKERPKKDFYEPNGNQALAAPIPSNKSISAYLDQGEQDWYVWDAPFDGVARYELSGADYSLSLVHIGGTDRIEQEVGAAAAQAGGSTVTVKKGRNYLKISGGTGRKATAYKLAVNFSIYRDAFEDNDRQFKAYRLPPRSQMVTGTFDHNQDQDWFTMTLDQSGTLEVKLTPDTARMDPVLTIFRKGERETVIDSGGDGASEAVELQVRPGQYFIRASNLSSYIYPVVGEYALDLHLATSYDDPFEPNDKSYQATVLNPDDNYYGVVDPNTDTDWFRFRLDGESLVEIRLSLLPDADSVKVQLFDSSLRARSIYLNAEGSAQVAMPRLAAGSYYLKVTSPTGQQQLLYGLRIRADRLVEGYSDLYSHWAEADITKLIRGGFVNGYGGYSFYPNRPITRAEAAVLMDRLLELPSAPPPSFRDVPSTHWAYAAIARLTKAGIVNGYSRDTFAPDRNITRMEMATLLANALGKKGYAGSWAPFTDVDSRYWGANTLRQLKNEGLISGYEDGTFRPELLASRAEFMSIAVRMLGL